MYNTNPHKALPTSLKPREPSHESRKTRKRDESTILMLV
jgi:hypothetical protein